MDAFTRAQDLRRDEKLLEARTALLFCSNEACPKLVRSECAKTLDELNLALPRLGFEAKDGAGQDLSQVTVTMDGQPLVDHLDGSPIAIDPGADSFVFKAFDLPPRQLTLVIREGDKARREQVTIGAAPKPEPPPVPWTHSTFIGPTLALAL